MPQTPSPFRRAALVSLMVVATAYLACKGSGPDGNNNQTPPTAKENVLAFVARHCDACNTQMIALEVVVEPNTGSQDTIQARADWRVARREFETIRFAPEQYLHQGFSVWVAWFPATTGFHHLESLMFIPSPNMTTFEYEVENIASWVRTIPTQLTNAGVSDSGIFHGLQSMLADVDSLKLSGRDASYSNNSFNDIFSNLAGLDSVYSFYRDSVLHSAPSVDTMFNGRIAATRAALTNAGSLQALDKAAFRTDELSPLQDALRQVARVYNINLP